MPLQSAFNRLFNEDITYWAPSTEDEYGDKTFVAPVTICCHWEDKVLAFFDSNGEEVHSRSIVYTDSLTENGGWLFRGTSVVADPTALSGADRIRQVMRVDDVHNRATVYKLVL